MSKITQAFVVNLKLLRLKKKLSQGVLAEKAGVSTSYISMLERGQRTPPLETVEKIAKAFQIDPILMLTPQKVEARAKG